jgi:hypothetical protein
MCTLFSLSISYGQIVVCDPAIEKPFNDWQPQHIRQGFAWRPGSVSFAVYDTDAYTVELCFEDQIVVQPHAERAIVVPFRVPQTGSVELAVVGDSHEVRIDQGDYALLFQLWHVNANSVWCRITFVPQAFARPSILRADAELSPSMPLLMEANPA